ncbi:MAG: hypothetical protein AVDCRST_MAG49-3844 [uncultured Thermomicrobiales bacterium]|uniref:Potassium channel domain-containing protein n=1 Tax=uncultured Thermomicrobiales bacterium TaxID=1645740 RepID=A0A6J4VE77_9BACT|nr:MAG: hypothetical protein AVDCRST_MAG49-3844 [uncultured Thermomicrobiales bacterium]
MRVLDVGSVLLGVVVLALVQADIVSTVLHPQAEGVLSGRVQRLGWAGFRVAARAMPRWSWGRRLLSWGFPLLVAGLIAFWLLGLLVGFALLYLPWVEDPAWFVVPDNVASAPVEALYFSGVTLLTIGYGEIHPVGLPFRTLAMLEAASGVLTVSLSVAYLLAVYPQVARQQAVAVALNAEVAGQTSGLPMLRRYLLTGRERDLSMRLRELALSLLDLTEAHMTHPVLYYVRPRRMEHSLLRVLVTAQGLIGALRYGLSPDEHADVVRDPQLLLLEEVFQRSLARLTAVTHGRVVPVDDAAERRALAAEFREVCAGLDALGFVSSRRVASVPVAPLVAALHQETAVGLGFGEVIGDGFASAEAPPTSGGERTGGDLDARQDPALDESADSAVAAYVEFRLATDPHLVAYAATRAYDLRQVRNGEHGHV